MKNAKRIIIAFLIPFLFAFLLLWLRKYIFAPSDSAVHFIFSDDFPLLQEQIYNFSIVGLFALSAFIPLFVDSGSKPIKRNDLNLSYFAD